MASPCTILQRSNPSLLQQNALDGVPLCFIVTAVQPAESRSWGGSWNIGRLRRMNALLLRLEGFC
jgi:hypothetical protein